MQKIIKRGSLVTAGNYTFDKQNVSETVEVKFQHFMIDNYDFYPVMTVGEVRNSINEDTGEYRQTK